MAQFDLNSYETVEERIRRFYQNNPQGRITTDLLDMEGDIGTTRWVVQANVYRSPESIEPDATGLAFEVDGAGMANRTSALENCETSAVGRALANLNYSGNKRASREEMQKVANEDPRQRFMAMMKSATTDEAKAKVIEAAHSAGAPPEFIRQLEAAR